MIRFHRIVLSALLVTTTLIITACGGGGGTSPAVSADTLSGVAAVGSPIVNGSVQIICAGGSTLNTTTSSTGAWQATISGQTLPCAIEVSGGTINSVANTIGYHSVATRFGTVNVTPFTDLMLANLVGTATPNIWFAGLIPSSFTPITSAAIDAALADQCAALSGLTQLCTLNPITTVFTPTGNNIMEYMLIALQASMLNFGVNYSSLLGNASIAGYAAPATNFNTALATYYAASTANISAIAITTAQSLTVGSAMTGFSPLMAIGGATPYTFSIASGTLPAGLTFNTSTGVVSGTPIATYAAADVVFSVVDVNNVVANTTSTVSFTVDPAPPTISATANTTAQSLTVGTAMTSFPPLTPGGGIPPYYYYYTGTLPDGLSYSSSTGVVSGAPTATYATANLIFSVQDANSVVASTTSTVSFTVSPASSIISATANTTAQSLTVGTAISFSPLLASGGVPPYAYSYTGILPAGLSFSTSTGAVTGTPTTYYASADVVFSVKDADNVVASTTSTVSFSVSNWSATGSMVMARNGATATLLDNGKVLVAGGLLTATTVELYDPATGQFTTAGSMSVARLNFTATKLPNGKVLIPGGSIFPGSGPGLASAELYDPATGLFSGTGTMAFSRQSYAATLLQNGKVLVVGGGSALGTSATASAEIYDPETELFTTVGSMAVARISPSFLVVNPFSATLLDNGKVLVAGGAGVSAELFDPSTGQFSATGDMVVGRFSHSATLLPNGKVLIAGGQGNLPTNLGQTLASAEVYDPATGQFTAVSDMSSSRFGYLAKLLPSGKVLVAGGFMGISVSASAELFDPSTGFWNPTGSLLEAKWLAASALLPSGEVLIAGGTSFDPPSASAELYHQ